ncbi:MAG: hypothetical protein PHQ52_06495, partial [Candidatus Omnitrophica bacterium]|nr:hypothetical protein [Candidatus Omnitrophota bacterium]
MKKIVTICMCFMFCFSMVVHGADDINFLKDELAEATRHYNAIMLTIQKLRVVYASSEDTQKMLKASYDELEKYKQKLIETNKKNILKVGMGAGLDTASLIGLIGSGSGVISNVSRGLIRVTTEVSKEGIGMAAQAYLNYDAPYDAKVGNLRLEAEQLKPELQEIAKILKMTKDEIRNSGNGADQLGDKGAVFRKFDMLISAVEKAQKKVYQLWKESKGVKPYVDGEIKKLEEEAKKFKNKMDEFGMRLFEQEKKEFKQKIDEKIKEVMSMEPGVDDLPFTVIAKVQREGMQRFEYEQEKMKRFKEWTANAFPEAQDLVQKDYAEILQQEIDQISSIKHIIKEMDQTIEKKKILLDGYIPGYDVDWISHHDQEAINAIINGPYSIISVYKDNVDSYEPRIKKGEDLPSLIADCDEIEEKTIELMVINAKKEKIREKIDKIIGNGSTLYADAHGWSASLPQQYTLRKEIEAVNKALIIGEDYSYGIKGSENFITYSETKKKIFEKMADDKEPYSKATSQREIELENAFERIMDEKKEQYTKALAIMENAENAYLQMLSAYEGYQKITGSSNWFNEQR